MIVLDTDVLVGWARPDTHSAVDTYLSQRADEQWLITTITLYEFLSFYSSQSRRRRERHRIEERIDGVVPFDTGATLEATDIENLLASSGTSLDAGDLFIAAIARDRGGTLATRNKNDFDKRPIHELMDVDIVTTS